MCWSAEGSLATYIVGMILSIISKFYFTTTPMVWLLGTEFTQMQLIEYFLWKNLNNPVQNEFWSKAGAGLIYIQPLITIWGIQNIKVRSALWALYGSVTLLRMLTSKINFSTEVAKNGHLRWNWMSFHKPYTYFWLLMFLGSIYLSKHYKTFWVSLFTVLMSGYFNFKYDSVGSYWCWIVVFVWLGGILYSK